MTWNYAYTPTIWPSLLTVFLMLAMGLYSLRRRNVPGVVPFFIGCLFGAVWAAGSVMEYAATELATKIFWIKFQTAWQLPAATTITCFVLEYAWPGRWLTRRNLTLLSIAPLLLIGLILVDNFTHLIWRSFSMERSVITKLGPGSWIAIIYSFGLIFLNLIVFIWLFRRSPQHRWPVAIMVIGQVGVRALYVLEKANIVHSVLPLDVLGLAFIILMYAIALFGFRFFDPVALASQTAIAQMRDGMLVLDSRGQVVSINSAAEWILGATLKQIRYKPIAELIPILPKSSNQTDEVDYREPIELTLRPNAEARSYELDFTPLLDFRGLPFGQLLLLHDVTEQSRTQALIVEQQRSLATLQEREHLARELHDELSQNLALINLQAQLVSGLLESGQAAQAQTQLQLLAKVAREVQVDVRGEIGRLSHDLVREKGFVGALSHFMETFQQSYGIETKLIPPGSDQTIAVTPAVGVQLLRIVQEAFTNIRKHAVAKNVCVAFMMEPGYLKILIEDDGIGFDPGTSPSSHQTFGLGIMSNRAREINGQVKVESVPGEGTKVTVMVPVTREQRTASSKSFPRTVLAGSEETR